MIGSQHGERAARGGALPILRAWAPLAACSPDDHRSPHSLAASVARPGDGAVLALVALPVRVNRLHRLPAQRCHRLRRGLAGRRCGVGPLPLPALGLPLLSFLTQPLPFLRLTGVCQMFLDLIGRYTTRCAGRT